MVRDKQVFLSLQKVGTVKDRDLEIVSVSDRVLRASLYAIPAEDATAIIDVVHLRISLVPADPLAIRPCILFCLDIDTVRRASRRAQIARNTLLLSVLIDV